MRPIVPLIRGGSDTDPQNLAAWKGNFKEAYDALFTYLVPDECIGFLRAISIPGGNLTINDIRDIKRSILTQDSQGTGKKRYSSRIEEMLINVDDYEDRLLHDYLPQMRHTNVHHIVPQSVGGLRTDTNEVRWPIGFHILYHRLFENMTLDEIEVFLRLINSSYATEKGKYMTLGGRVVNISCKKASKLRKLIKQYSREHALKAA